MAALSLIPLSFVALERASFSKLPRIDFIPDLDEQQKFKPQSENTMFADGRAMRPQVKGTIPYKTPKTDDHFYRGLTGESWATSYPVQVKLTKEFLLRGQSRFNIFCATCHGYSGAGNGPVALRADELQQGTWTPPTNLLTEPVRNREAGHIFNTISNGIRNMPAHGPQIPVSDRWAIVAYVRALQRSNNATLSDVPPEMRDEVALKLKGASSSTNTQSSPSGNGDSDEDGKPVNGEEQ